MLIPRFERMEDERETRVDAHECSYEVRLEADVGRNLRPTLWRYPPIIQQHYSEPFPPRHNEFSCYFPWRFRVFSVQIDRIVIGGAWHVFLQKAMAPSGLKGYSSQVTFFFLILLYNGIK